MNDQEASLLETTAAKPVSSNELAASSWKDSISSGDSKDASGKKGSGFALQPSHQLSGTTLILDSRDEAEKEDEDSSSLGYSDDSASLSDAYFHPQPGDNLARPHGRLAYGNTPVNPYQSNSFDGSIGSYGSLPQNFNNNNITHHGPFWLGGPIQEDVETMLPYHAANLSGSQAAIIRNNKHNVLVDAAHPNGGNHSESSALLSPPTSKHPSKRDRRYRGATRHHRHVQKMHVKHREHAVAREKLVSQIRGQPQELTSWQDSFWAVLFLTQLVLVAFCALRFGFGVILFRDHPVWGNNLAATNSTWLNGTDGTRFLDVSPEVNASLHLLNSTTSAQDIPRNASLKDILFSQDDIFLTSNELNSTQTGATDGSFTIDYKNVLAITFFAGFYACMLSYISFGFMLILARSLILIMLVFSIVVALAWGVIGLTLDPYGVISVVGFAALLSSLGYAMYSWHRIPFAATNLYTALTAMRCTADITILGLMTLVVAFSWCLLWSMAFIGIVNAFNDNDCISKDVCHAHVNRKHIPVLLLLLVSFHWTAMVMKNIVRVTVASAIGTWWFNPSEIEPFCTSAVIAPLSRSLTLSLGSICLGSLVISPAQWILSLGRFCCCCMEGDAPTLSSDKMNCIGHDGTASHGKPSGFLSLLNIGDTEDGSVSGGVVADTHTTVDSPADNFAVCRRVCALVEPCHRWLRSCNRWAFTYIGMYSYSFITAGDKALQLFETRGWMEVVEDTLIQNVLLMASVVIGGSTGVFAVVVEETDGYDFTSLHQPIITAFVIGSVLGYVLSNILLLGVVGSAVSTVLCCFAAAPFEFDKNHPRLSREMRDVWSQQVWEPATTQIVNTLPSTRSHHHHSGAAIT